jgi:hypothetical protein
MPIEILKILWFSDPEFQQLVADRFQILTKKLQKELGMVSAPVVAPKTHREAILAILRGNPGGLNVAELRGQLETQKHPIGSRVLNTVLNSMKIDQDLKTIGHSPTTKFLAT